MAVTGVPASWEDYNRARSGFFEEPGVLDLWGPSANPGSLVFHKDYYRPSDGSGVHAVCMFTVVLHRLASEVPETVRDNTSKSTHMNELIVEGMKLHFKASGIEYQVLERKDNGEIHIQYRGRRTRLVSTQNELAQISELGWND